MCSCRVDLPAGYMLKGLQSQAVRRGEITTTVNFARATSLIVFVQDIDLQAGYMLKGLHSQAVRRGEITITVNFAEEICLIVFM